MRFFLGTHITRLAKSKNGTNYDLSHAGTERAVNLKLRTGIVFPEGSPLVSSAFKRFILYYKPSTNYNISVNVAVDNQTLDTTSNSLSYTTLAGTALLGTTFILDSSVLGESRVMGPETRVIDGHGRGVKIEITQTGVNESLEIQGFGLQYEPIGVITES